MLQAERPAPGEHLDIEIISLDRKFDLNGSSLRSDLDLDRDYSCGVPFCVVALKVVAKENHIGAFLRAPSVPQPMATPTLASVNAGASLTLSLIKWRRGRIVADGATFACPRHFCVLPHRVVSFATHCF